MAETAILCGWQVAGMLTDRGNAIVARGAIVYDIGVIKYAGGETVDAMAHTAILGSGNVCG